MRNKKDCTHVRPTIERFKEKFAVDAKTGCWIWTGAISKSNGYGKIKASSKTTKDAHKWSYEYHNNTVVPKGHDVAHLCKVRRCVNPEHLKAMSRKDHVALDLPDTIELRRSKSKDTKLTQTKKNPLHYISLYKRRHRKDRYLVRFIHPITKKKVYYGSSKDLNKAIELRDRAVKEYNLY